MAGKVQNIKDGDDVVKRCLWVAEEKVDEIKDKIKRYKSSIEITGSIKKLEYFWVSGKKEVIEEVCHDCTKHSMSTAVDSITHKDDIGLVRCLLEEPLHVKWPIGIRLECHFILSHDDDNDVSTTAKDIINKLCKRDCRYKLPIITYDIKIVQVAPTWEYVVQGLPDGTPKREQRCINALIDISSFRSDGHFMCPDKVHSDICAVLHEVWPDCNISIQEIHTPSLI